MCGVVEQYAKDTLCLKVHHFSSQHNVPAKVYVCVPVVCV